jgi:hypothetical protein
VWAAGGVYSTMYCARAICATCTDNPGCADNVYCTTHKDIDSNMGTYKYNFRCSNINTHYTKYPVKDSNMDDYSIEDSNGSTTDEQSDVHIHGDTYAHYVNGNPFPVLFVKERLDTKRDGDSNGDEDTGRAGHAAENGNVRAGNSGVDPDHNGDK